MTEQLQPSPENPEALKNYWQLKDYDIKQLLRQAIWFLISRLAILGICCAIPAAFGWFIGWLCS